MTTQSSSPGPDRDRQLAAQPRDGYRAAALLGETLAQLRASKEYASMRRFARVHGALERALPATAHGKVRAIGLRDGVLTLEVANGVLLAELRSTCARRLLSEFATARTGISRLTWRVARRS
ncbi:MAG: DciA family protein [Planctomycetota bacterium]